jgi:hypothetical protein
MVSLVAPALTVLLWVGFFFWECGVLVRFASAQPTTPPGTPATACHFLKDKKIPISLRRRFQFWLLSVLSVFAGRVGQRTRPVVD